MARDARRDEDVYRFTKLLASAMVVKAESLNVEGVAGALVLETRELEEFKNTLPLLPTQFQICLQGDMLERPSKSNPEIEYNLPLTCSGKIFEMVRTGKDSGTVESLHSGEPGLKGGIVLQQGSYTIFVAYSGGTSEQDLEICRTVLQVDALFEMVKASGLLELYIRFQ